MKQRDFSIDFIRFIAIIFITNSHFQPLYSFYPALATLGVHGNALFFFISGYALTLGNSVLDGFIPWYKKRISRIWPTIIIWTISTNLLFHQPITWKDFLLASNYWFIQCIIIYYIILYFLNKVNISYLVSLFFCSILLFFCIVVFTSKTFGSIYHSFHFFCYFPSMILGLYCGKKQPTTKFPITKTIISFIAYFIIMSIGKNKETVLYYTQLAAIIPLNLFVYYMFTCKNTWNKIITYSHLKQVISIISSLSLEIYIVQFSLITKAYNDYFPFNFMIIILSIIIVAYFLKIITTTFIQTISKDNYNLKNIFKP